MEKQKYEIHELTLKRMGIDTYQEAVVYMRADCHVCRSEGFEAHTRVKVCLGEKSVIATLNVVYDTLLTPGEAGLSEIAWKLLSPEKQDKATFTHAPTVESLSDVRKKVYGHRLDEKALNDIVHDISLGRYSDVHLASFITSCAGESLDIDEITYLTKAMVNVGESLKWDKPIIVDKHCIGGLPGNRTTPIVVAIAAAYGLSMPKTSSRAITSPAGTADMMEVLAPVNLTLKEMRDVVSREGGCIVWGGAVHLSPADDIMIRIERALDLDSEGQMIASVLSKKKAAGSTHVIIDIPMGKTAKVRDEEMARKISYTMEVVGERIGLKVRTVITDGSQPIGRGIGPALEAKDVLAVLRNEDRAPVDLKEKALVLAGHILELSGEIAEGQGKMKAEEILSSGQAWNKFKSICNAQGGLKEPGTSTEFEVIKATKPGMLHSIDNRKLSRVAKLAGAPHDKTAGVHLEVQCGEHIEEGQPLFTLHAESKGELHYSLEYVSKHDDIFEIKNEER